MKKGVLAAVLSVAVTLNFAGFAFAAGSIAHGDISVYKGNQLADKLSGQNPVEDGALLVCDGKCMIKSKGISLVAADKAKLALMNEDANFNLFIREGHVNYVITDNSRTIAFHTPDNTYSVAEVIFNAGSASVVRGYVQVNENGQTEVGVTEGRMVFTTAEGKQTVDANNKIVLAMVNVDGATEGATKVAATTEVAATSTGGLIVAGAFAGGTVLALAATSDQGDGTPATVQTQSTPSTPSAPAATQTRTFSAPPATTNPSPNS